MKEPLKDLNQGAPNTVAKLPLRAKGSRKAKNP